VLPKQTDSTIINLKPLQKTYFFPPTTKKKTVNGIKDQTLLQPPTEIKRQTQKPFLFQQRPRIELLNNQKDFLFHQKPHKNPNFTRKSIDKQKKTSFCMKNHLKDQPLHAFPT